MAQTAPVIVAGDVGPTGEIMEPLGPLSYAAAVEIFHEQIEGLKAGGADVAWVETISAPDEFKAAAEACGRADMPWCGTMSFDTAGRTMMGVTTKDMVNLVAGLDHKPLAFGANCGVGASDLLRTVLGMTAVPPDLPVIAKGNAGIPKYVDGHIPLRRHACADGRLCPPCHGQRGQYYRRVLRDNTRSLAGHAAGHRQPYRPQSPDVAHDCSGPWGFFFRKGRHRGRQPQTPPQGPPPRTAITPTCSALAKSMSDFCV